MKTTSMKILHVTPDTYYPTENTENTPKNLLKWLKILTEESFRWLHRQLLTVCGGGPEPGPGSFLDLLCPWGFSRQEYWSGLPCPLPGDLPHPGI